MAKKVKQPQPEQRAPEQQQNPTFQELVPRAGTIRLLQDSIDARGQKCAAGTVIAPDVDGWPAHRVERHRRNGLAK